jgi:nucleoid-associated protein YgaU
MTVRIKKDAWLQFGELTLIDGIEFWDVVDLPTIVEQPDDLRYTVQQTDRLDLLAQRFYGSPRLKWVLMAANDLELEPTEISEGDVLRIPAPRYVIDGLFGDAVVQ